MVQRLYWPRVLGENAAQVAVPQVYRQLVILGTLGAEAAGLAGGCVWWFSAGCHDGAKDPLLAFPRRKGLLMIARASLPWVGLGRRCACVA